MPLLVQVWRHAVAGWECSKLTEELSRSCRLTEEPSRSWRQSDSIVCQQRTCGSSRCYKGPILCSRCVTIQTVAACAISRAVTRATRALLTTECTHWLPRTHAHRVRQDLCRVSQQRRQRQAVSQQRRWRLCPVVPPDPHAASAGA
eukprot:3316615-Prymnesium_polylepis.1